MLRVRVRGALEGSVQHEMLLPFREQLLTQLRAEGALPRFHELRLFQGEREFLEDSFVDVELQGIKVSVPDEALATLDAIADGRSAYRGELPMDER